MPSKTARTLAAQYKAPATTQVTFELPTFTFEHESLVAGTNIPAPPREPSPAPPAAVAKKQEPANPLRSHPTTPDEASQGAAAQVVQNGGAGPTSAPSETPGLNTNTAVTAAGAAPGMKRPHHVRRLLSMRSLSQAFNGGSHGRTDSNVSTTTMDSDFGPPTSGRRTPSIFGRSSTSTWGRPSSRGGASTVGSTYEGTADGKSGRRTLKKRMSSGFWSRRSSFAANRVFDDRIPEDGVAPVRQRTPPPQLPEIASLKIGKEIRDKSGGFLSGEDMFKGIEYKPEI